MANDTYLIKMTGLIKLETKESDKNKSHVRVLYVPLPLRKHLTCYQKKRIWLSGSSFLAPDRKGQSLKHPDDDADKQWKLMQAIKASPFQLLFLQKKIRWSFRFLPIICYLDPQIKINPNTNRRYPPRKMSPGPSRINVLNIWCVE